MKRLVFTLVLVLAFVIGFAATANADEPGVIGEYLHDLAPGQGGPEPPGPENPGPGFVGNWASSFATSGARVIADFLYSVLPDTPARAP